MFPSITMVEGASRMQLWGAAMKSLLKCNGRIYIHFAKATIERFGREGEMPVRLGLLAYGLWRG